LIIEALGVKLSLDLLIFFKKYRIYCTNLRIGFFDNEKSEFIDFRNLDELQSYYNDNYIPLDICSSGDLASLVSFRATSDAYNFSTDYRLQDITGNYKLVPGRQYDRQRDVERARDQNRQITLINQSIGEYNKFYNEIKNIFTTGIYSPCYAQPGWSENTWYLNSLRQAFTDPKNRAFASSLSDPADISKFPYTNEVIQKRPPESFERTTTILPR
tara:strand:+ start:6810 stop:7454 length:645 start_codon:yes stop_codon:yes gene_type:complete